MLTFVALFVCAITLLIYLMFRRFKYWERKNVPTGKVIPFFGDNYEICMGMTSPGDMILKMYNKVSSEHRYVGGYLFHVPILVLRTPDIIKQFCVKDTEHFVDHGNIILNSSDDLWQKALFPLKGNEWKEVRQILSPILNGHKVKLMFPLLGRHVKKFIAHSNEKNEEIAEVDIKDVLLRILNDISSDVALGMEVDSFKDPNNLVFDVGVSTCNLSIPYKKLVLLLYTLCQSVPKFFGMSLFGDGKNFFINAVRDTIKMRQAKGIKRADMIGILMDVREEQLKAKDEASQDGKNMRVVTDEEMASYVFVMYFGVIDSVTTLLAFLAWELAVAPEIQDKLRKECDETPKDGEEVTYKDIMEMKYMDMVISEVLRKWPGAIATDRLVTKPYTIEPELPHEKPVYLDVGDNIFLPIYAIHRDPKYYEDPDKFDPERFSPENKHKIDPNAYLPFGVGPRYCVGTRFSMLVMKVIFYYLMKSFELVPVKSTAKELVMDKEALSLYPVGGFPLGLKRR